MSGCCILFGMVLDKEKLYFKCKGCGKCCGGAPGYVWASEDEIVQMANYLQISQKEFMRLYVRRVFNRLSLKELAGNYDCVFLKDGKCRIYPVRPEQCKTFPWWPENLKSEEAWQDVQNRCEGTRP